MQSFKERENLIPNIQNPSPDYYCTWQTQLYATSDGKPAMQRCFINENALFGKDIPNGWAYFYENARKDLYFLMDCGWDVDADDVDTLSGGIKLYKDKFPSFAKDGVSDSEALSALNQRLMEVGWKGLALWIASQQCVPISDDREFEEYWKERLLLSQKAKVYYWKLDLGDYSGDIEFRRRLAELCKAYTPEIVLENANFPELIPCSDAYRTYDVPEIMSIPMTLGKIYALREAGKPKENFNCLVNCEDEVYIAASLGFTMGVMRHPFAGSFTDGRKDMSFPECHRNLKTKMAEVTRAVRWHKLAPAFAFDSSKVEYSKEMLSDNWQFKNKEEEIEEWWFGMYSVKDCLCGDTISMSAPSIICRGMKMPCVSKDKNGYVPYITASKTPNGVISVATLGRTIGHEFFNPLCDVTLFGGTSDTFGVFGYYNKLIIKTECRTDNITVLMQDIADDKSFDVTKAIEISEGCIIVPGELISKIGTIANGEGDTSEPGTVIKLCIG